MKIFMLLFIVPVVLVSCVSAKKYKEAEALQSQAWEVVVKKNEALNTSRYITTIQDSIMRVQRDALENKDKIIGQQNQMVRLYEEMVEKMDSIAAETQKICPCNVDSILKARNSGAKVVTWKTGTISVTRDTISANKYKRHGKQK